MATFNIEARYVKAPGSTIIVRQYADGSLAVQAEYEDDEGYPEVETLSLNLGAYGLTPTVVGEFYCGDYSQYEGLPDALVKAGVASIVERITFGPHGTRGALMRLNDEVSA